MIILLSMLAAVASPAADAQPYQLGAPATADGAKLTVKRLLDATFSKDDIAFDKVARGIVFMLAPDFAAPVSREKFEASFKDCTPPLVTGTAPFSKLPKVQAVRISMKCHTKDHPEPIEAMAEIMADDEHAFAVFPGGVTKVWPEKKR